MIPVGRTDQIGGMIFWSISINSLYYRLNVVRVDMPPLKQRKDDIAMLAHHFLKKYERISGKHFEGIRHNALVQLNSYDWPGNVRELENVMESRRLIGPSRAKKRGPAGARCSQCWLENASRPQP